MAWVRRYRWWLVTAVVVTVGAAVAVVVWWPRSPAVEEPRARQFQDFDVCLLTPAQGLADPQVAAVWAGAQEVSLTRSVRVRYRQVSGEQTAERAGQFLASLVQQGCEVIVAVGPAPAAAAGAYEAGHASVMIVAVGDGIDGSSPETIEASTVDVLLGLVPAG